MMLGPARVLAVFVPIDAVSLIFLSHAQPLQHWVGWAGPDGQCAEQAQTDVERPPFGSAEVLRGGHG